MRLNRKGVTRLVFVFKKVVVKIPNFTCQWNHFLKGMLANIEENKIWKCSHIKDSHAYGNSHLLCPVIWSSWGGWVLVMQKADRCLTFEEHDLQDISEHKKYFPGDDTASNYGILNGNLVKIDYGQIDRQSK